MKRYSTPSFFFLFIIISFSCKNTPTPSEWKMDLIPQVSQLVKLTKGGLIIHENWQIYAPDSLNAAALELSRFFKSECGLGITPSEDAAAMIQFKIEDGDFGMEGYSLEIKENRILLASDTETGIHRGISSLKQLVLLNEFKGNYFLPYLEIKDHARFPHRGLLLDCSRHFFEVDVVKKYIDLLSLFKMNTLHWHITEDQGWRIAIDQYPELTKVGAYRKEKDGSTYGGFYTKEQIREIVAYASEKHINIIPEIELPGHSQAAIASYPHLSCTGESVPVANDWGVFKEIYCAGNDSTFIFLENVLTEVMELFPSKKIHIGGDEAPKTRWSQCAKCQRRIKEEGLKNEEELQSYFIKRIQTFLKKHDRELIGWDEILEGGLAEGAIVQSWRGMDGGIEAVKHGHQAIMSPTSHAYLDYGLDAIDLEKVHSFEPIPEGLSAEEAQLIIGGECNMWTEHVPDEKTLDSRVFPRMLAMSEVLWSNTSGRDFKEFHQRIQAFYPVLERFGVQYGEEAIPMRHKMHLENNEAKVELIPYANDISLKYQFKCEGCDSTAQVYEAPLTLKNSGELSIQASKNNRKYGEQISIPFAQHSGINSEVSYTNKYSEWYTAGGDKGLTDAQLGTLNFRDGAWQGFWGDDLECTLQLRESMSISSISANFYQYNNSWIFIPPKMTVEVSNDGKNWTTWGTATSDADPKQRGKFIRTLSVESDSPQQIAFVKVKVENFGKVPDWHEAAGSDAWIFIDEIILK